MSAPKPPPPWLFGVTCIPYGVVGSFSTIVMPFLAVKADISIGDIGWFVALLFIPPMLQFLYTPIVDWGLKRKHWLVIMAIGGAACTVAACMVSLRTHLTLFLVLCFLAQTLTGFIGSCNGGLMATLIPDDKRGKAGAWYNVGNLSGGGISAGIAVWMSGHDVAPELIGAMLGAMMVLPALAALAIDEPAREAGSVRDVLSNSVRDVGRVLFSRVGITGVLLCLSPVGTAALANFFSAIGFEYVRADIPPETASDNFVAIVQHCFYTDAKGAKEIIIKAATELRTSDLLFWLQGPTGQIIPAVGALAGGLLCDRYNRRAMYLVAGLLTAVVGIAMVLSPQNETTFIWGVIAYSLVTGFCYCAFTATVLDTIGTAGKSAATQYSLFVAAGNAAINYVGFVDTRFADNHGVQGVVASDAILNIAGVVALGVAFWWLGLFKRRVPVQT